MNGVRFWSKITVHTLGKLCQQRMLLAGVALLCLILPLCLAPAAESALSQGVSFSGLTLAIVGPEGSSTPEKAENLLSSMRDVSEYCEVRAMTREDALESLKRGEITAILVLPKRFVSGVMNGTNPDVELIVPGDRPFEALLTLWVGQSATDILSAVQSGIYTVLEQYDRSAPEGLDSDEVVNRINLRYVNWTLNRQAMFRTQTVSATELLPVGTHYALSLLAYLVLATAPFFTPVFSGKWIAAQRRFRTAKRGTFGFFFCSVGACFAVLLVLLTGAQMLIVKGDVMATVFAAGVCALFCSAYTGLCCLLTNNTRNCGVLSFPCSLVFLFLSGGILPPVLMPESLQGWMKYAPVTWMRNVMAVPGDNLLEDGTMTRMLLLSGVIMLAIGGLLYRHRSIHWKEDAQ